jgi:hypothetical protein
VDKCTGYRFVEDQHQQPHVGKDPLPFTPRDGSPSLQLITNASGNFADGSYEFSMELDVYACADFVKDKGRWKKMMPKDTLLKAGFNQDYVPT